MRVELSWLFPCLSAVAGVAWGWSGDWGPDVRFLAVGQGDCIVYRDAGRTLMVDAGPKNPFVDAGERVVVPHLRALGIGSIDALLLTHPDVDHFGGLETISRSVKIRKVLISSEFRGRREFVDCLRAAGIPDTAVIWLPRRYSLSFGDTKAEFFAPNIDSGEDDNAGSVIVRISAKAGSVLLTGDAGFSAEAEEIAAGFPLRSQIMKAGHHGSSNSTSSEYLAAVQPSWIVVTCGRNNRFGHPARSTLAKAQRAGVPVLRTDQDGTVGFRLTDAGVERLAERVSWR